MAAHLKKPSIIFLDGLEGLASSNSKKNENILSIRNAFCREMENIKDGVFVMCTTNEPQKLMNYPNVLGHFRYLIYISVPNKVDRLNMLKKLFTEKLCENFGEEHFEELAVKTRG